MMEKDEQAILAYFNTPETANQCADQLKKLGIQDISIDRFSRFAGAEMTEHLTNPINGFDSHLHLVGGVEDATTHEGRLLGSDPSISGIADGTGEISGRDICLAVVCKKTQTEQVLAIINEHGGRH